jgi:hypothetical protein
VVAMEIYAACLTELKSIAQQQRTLQTSALLARSTLKQYWELIEMHFDKHRNEAQALKKLQEQLLAGAAVR